MCVLPGDRPLAEPAALDGAKSQAQWVVRAQPLPSGQCWVSRVQSPWEQAVAQVIFPLQVFSSGA